MSVDEKSTNPLAMKHGSGWVDHREPRKTVSASLHVLCFSLFWGSIWQSCPQHPEYHGVAKLDRKRATLGWLKMVDQDEWFWCQMEVSRNGGIPIKSLLSILQLSNDLDDLGYPLFQETSKFYHGQPFELSKGTPPRPQHITRTPSQPSTSRPPTAAISLRRRIPKHVEANQEPKQPAVVRTPNVLDKKQLPNPLCSIRCDMVKTC